ncbi:MAG: hypothetical protein MJK15_18360 [Colwellia sp.]|nr:hypothetical protein [Colwellia sp.]
MYKLPKQYLPVIRRLREKRQSTAYNPLSNVIYLLEEQAPEDFIFSLYHEVAHSCHMNSNIGLFLDTLRGIKSGIAQRIVLRMECPNPHIPSKDFYSSEARTNSEKNEVFASHNDFYSTNEGRAYLRKCSELFEEESFQELISAYNELEKRENILLDEWRFPQEGFAVYTEICGLANIERTYDHAMDWAEALGEVVDKNSFKLKIREMEDSHGPLMQNSARAAVSPEVLASSPLEDFDVYDDGVSFLLKYFGNERGQLEVSEAIQAASQIPIFRLPGLDAPFSEFKAAVMSYCSPRIRLARLASYKKEGEFTYDSFKSYLSHATNHLPEVTNGYIDFTDWEYSQYWNSKLLLGLRGNQIIEPPVNTQQTSKDFHKMPYQSIDMKVLAVVDESVISCDIQYDIGALPTKITDADKKMITSQLEREYFIQSFEGVKYILSAYNKSR